MSGQDKEFEKRLLATFLIEAEEHIRSVSNGLTELEKGLSGDELNARIETMFRDVHSLKGAARSVGQKEVEALCHPLESVFSSLKRHEIVLIPGLMDLFHDSVNTINLILSSPDSAPAISERGKLRSLISRLGEAAKGKGNLTLPTAPSEKLVRADSIHSAEEIKQVSGSVRVQAKRLDPLLLQAEELMISKTAYGQRVSDCYDIQNELQAYKVNLANRPQVVVVTKIEGLDSEIVKDQLEKLKKEKAAMVKLEGPRHRKVTVLRKKKDAVKYAALIYQIGKLEKQFKSLYPPIWYASEYIGNGGYWQENWTNKHPKDQTVNTKDWWRSKDKDRYDRKDEARKLKEARANIRALTPPADEAEELSQAA